MPAVTPAGLGRRAAAGLIDSLLMGVLFVLFAAALGESETSGANARFNLSGLPALAYLLAVLGYFLAFEAAIGRTLGKLALGLRVVRTDGTKAEGGPVALRTLLRLVDGLPVLYLVGFVCLLATGKRRQRIGDIAAGTTVVRG